MNIFASLVMRYLASNPQIVERLAAVVVCGVIDHIAPKESTSSLMGEAVASPLAGSQGLRSAGAQVISQ